MIPPEHFVSITGLHYARGSKKIFDGIDLTISRNKVTAIMGPSGTGKTTLLRMIGRQLQPTSGQIFINNTEITTLPARRLKALRQEMGLLFQESGLFTDLNVFENVAFLLREHTRLPEDMIRDLVLMKLEAVGLRGAASLAVNELSGGMVRRVALARAMMLDPQLMMYYEPFSGQDPINRGVLLKLIRELNDALGLTSVIVSHDVQEVIAIADWVYVLANGRVMGAGHPSELMNGDASPEVQQFVKGLPDGPVPFKHPARDYREELLAC